MIRTILCKDYDEMSVKAARILAGQVNLKPDCVLGLATGSTPVGMYTELARMCNDGEVDFSEVTTFNLDEYYPIKQSNRQSYRYFMNENLFSKINIDINKTHVPNGEVENPDEECERYEKSIRESGGIDLQILGIGQNGHIGFNEPDACLNSYTHLTGLTENTMSANSRFFSEDEVMPDRAITMGISTILDAKKIILLASGASKSRVVAELLNDEINTSIPASMLKTHPDVVLICDEDAYTGARLGVDIGGTNIKFAVIDNGEVLHRDMIDTADTCEQIISDIASKTAELREKFNVKTVGVGTPGLIKNGCVSAVNIPFDKTPLKKLLSEKIGLPISVDNDANCAALGEIEFGNASDCENIVLVTIGTGVGGGIIMNRQICRGNNSMGEIGHIIIQANDGRPCPCGLNGCWEQYASITALISDAENAAKENPESILNSLYKKNKKLNGEIIFDAISQNCPVANAVFDKYLDYLAAGINSIANVFGPDAIILAGGITQQGDKLLKPLIEKIALDIRVEISSLQSNAGSYGAAML